jgi:hypothetical protein
MAALLAGPGCQHYGERDVALLSKHGGRFVLSGEGPGRYVAPVGSVIFDDPERRLTDEEFAVVFPAVQHMDPMVLLIRGDHTISDSSVPLLNQLRAVEHLDVSGTELSVSGIKRLRLEHLESLVVAARRTSDEQAADLRCAFPSVKVTRWQASTQQQAAAGSRPPPGASFDAPDSARAKIDPARHPPLRLEWLATAALTALSCRKRRAAILRSRSG